ncbi:hypothetical protein [Enterovibrio sp. 27052020O]|uniref:hypothetical protein n=1 Tax=Enterovibrio sp. 27052020O TaxID=3241166 RepID=UPI00388FEE76
MKQIDLTRRATMRTLLIAGGSCLALSQINIWKQPKRALASTTDNAKSLAAAEELELSSPEQDVFVAIKKNLTYSKTVKDEQIAEFAKRIVDTSPPNTDFKHAFSSLQKEFQLMEYFIRYIHA